MLNDIPNFASILTKTFDHSETKCADLGNCVCAGVAKQNPDLFEMMDKERHSIAIPQFLI